MRPTRAHTTPLLDFEKFESSQPGTVVWKEGNRSVLVAHLPDWWGGKPEVDPPVLAFLSVLGRTYMGTFLSLEEAVGVLVP